MMSSKQLQKLLTSMDQEPQNLHRVLEYGEEFCERFTAFHVQLLVQFCLRCSTQLSTDEQTATRVIRLLSRLAPLVCGVKLQDADQIDFADNFALNMLLALAPALQVSFSAAQLVYLRDHALFELLEASSFASLADPDAFCEQLPLLTRLRCYFELRGEDSRVRVLNQALQSGDMAEAELEALADALGDSNQEAILRQLDFERVCTLVQQKCDTRFGLAIALNYMTQIQQARDVLAPIVLQHFNLALPEEELEIYALIFALLGLKNDLLALFFETAGAGKPYFGLYERILPHIDQIGDQQQLERYVELCCQLYRLDDITQTLSRNLVESLMDVLAEPNAVLASKYEQVMFCLESYGETYCCGKCAPEDEDVATNIVSWGEYVDSWLRHDVSKCAAPDCGAIE